MTLTAIVIIDGVQYEKRLHHCEMTKPIWKICPTEQQLSSPQWLKTNGWRLK